MAEDAMGNGGRGEGVAERVRGQASAVAAGMEQRIDDLRGYAEDAGTMIREYAREHPWTAVGIAAGIGFLLGRLLSRT
jgi:ElaB/YqjD/DUF883 family membrane-anchored ribosome-binding protein